jgi:hypothetical protein
MSAWPLVGLALRRRSRGPGRPDARECTEARTIVLRGLTVYIYTCHMAGFGGCQCILDTYTHYLHSLCSSAVKPVLSWSTNHDAGMSHSWGRVLAHHPRGHETASSRLQSRIYQYYAEISAGMQETSQTLYVRAPRSPSIKPQPHSKVLLDPVLPLLPQGQCLTSREQPACDTQPNSNSFSANPILLPPTSNTA